MYPPGAPSGSTGITMTPLKASWMPMEDNKA
eukprot:SAG22_NODE_303_length_12721_cov_3.439075_1_plen_30_part_10